MIRNLKNLLERDLSKERHELLKDQRLFRNRARKHFIETNKRRRALEEKWKEDEEKEQKLREQILLQRKLKHQEATEKFQRGHLPSSQRKRNGVQRKRELKLDEAFQKIQVTGIHLSPSKVIGRAADSASSATRNDPFHWKQTSIKAGYDRTVQENSRANLNSDQLPFQQNLEEMQQQMHEQHFYSVQDFHQEVNEIVHPESVCSIDSLETGEPNESYTAPTENSLSAHLDSSVHNSQGLQTRNESFSEETDMTSAKSQHVNNWLINLNTSDIQTTSPFRDILIKYNVEPSNEDTSSPDQKSSFPGMSEGREADDNLTFDNNLTFAQNTRDKNVLWRHPSSAVVSTEDPFATETSSLKLNKAWAIAEPSPVVSLDEKGYEFPKNNNRTLLAQTSSQNAAVSVVFPARQWSSTASYQKSSIPSMSEGGEAERCPSDDNLTFAQNKRNKSFLWRHPCAGVISTEGPFATETPALKLNKAWAISDPSSVVSQEEKKELPKNNNRTLLAEASCQNAVISVAFPARQCSSTASYHSTFIANCVQKGKGAHVARCTGDTECITGAKDEKDDHIDVVSLCEEMSKSDIDEQAVSGEGSACEINSSAPFGDLAASESDLVQQDNNPNERKAVKLPKSILKKESKYESASFRAVVVNRGVRFGKQPVSSARDSVELAKMKVKDADSQKNCKKLRWFDEIDSVVGANDDEKCSEQSAPEMTQTQTPSAGLQIKTAASRTLRSIPSCILNSVFPEYQQEASQTSARFATAEERDNEIKNAFVSTEYHVAKQAWAAQRGEEMMPLVYNVDPKSPKSNPRKGRTKMIKRPKSAKAPSTFITKNRKGTIIRPQSATEATKVMKTQGKIMVPRPPCKPVPSQRPDENPADRTYQSVNFCKSQANAEDSDVNGNHVSSEGQDLDSNTTEDSSPSSFVCCPHAATMRPSYSIFTYEPMKKTKSITNTAQSVSRCSSYTKRNMLYSENRLCPDRTPTDEEITLLWQGVHRALAQKDSAAGDSQHCDSICSNSNNGDLQPPRASVSHITIDGGNLMSRVKSGVKMNAMFSSPPITSVSFARRKQSAESIENKRRALLEQRRQMTASAGRKPSGAGQNVTQATKCTPPQYAGEAMQGIGINNSDEVSDSTTQFLLAENLANMSATESEILADLETVQPYRQTTVLSRAPRKGMSALSFEEHKVLQSLDRINQRLQNVHETINKIPSSTSVLQTISPLVASPSYMDIIRPRQRYRNISDDTRNLIQRRY